MIDVEIPVTLNGHFYTWHTSSEMVVEIPVTLKVVIFSLQLNIEQAKVQQCLAQHNLARLSLNCVCFG